MKSMRAELTKLVFIFLFLLGIPNITASSDGPKPKLNIDSNLYNYGEVIQGEKIEHAINIRNTGKGDLVIESAKPD